jgi:hypothetical protein
MTVETMEKSLMVCTVAPVVNLPYKKNEDRLGDEQIMSQRNRNV